MLAAGALSTPEVLARAKKFVAGIWQPAVFRGSLVGNLREPTVASLSRLRSSGFFRSEAFNFARGTIGVSLGISAMVMVLGLLGNVFHEADALAEERFARSFSLVTHGMHRVEVFRRLGKPEYKADGFYLGSREDFEAEYAAAAASPSDHYYVWYRSSEAVFTIGFSDDDIVTFKAAGRK